MAREHKAEEEEDLRVVAMIGLYFEDYECICLRVFCQVATQGRFQLQAPAMLLSDPFQLSRCVSRVRHGPLAMHK